jgi:hypothetical protein
MVLRNTCYVSGNNPNNSKHRPRRLETSRVRTRTAVPAVVFLGYWEVNKKILTAAGKGERIGIFFW